MTRMVPSRANAGSDLYELVFNYPLRDAKALRPALCIATCMALAGPRDAVLPSATVLELYHNAFLIHDDIEDQSERRRRGPTLHRQHGSAIALNVGDAMLALTLSPLLENTRFIGLGRALRVLQIISRMARESAEGQAIELTWIRSGRFDQRDGEYLRMVHKKTGHYSFLAPVLIGGIVAGAPEDVLARLARFATLLGTAFQIQDDVLNLDVAPERHGKDALGDLWEGKHTLILLHALRAASDADRAKARHILSKPRPNTHGGDDCASTLRAKLRDLESQGRLAPEVAREIERVHDGKTQPERSAEDVEFLLGLIRRHDSIPRARRMAVRRALRARRALERVRPALGPSPHFDFLDSLSEFVTARDH
jgi:geranylgeranyl diphosphate synthase type II